MSGGTWAEGKSSVSTGDPCLQQEDKAHKTWHTETSAMDYRTHPGKDPSPEWPWAPICLPGSKPDPSLKLDAATSSSERGHKQASKPSKGVQTSPREAAPSLGSAMEPHSPGLPTPAPPGLLTSPGEVLAAGSSPRTGSRG